MNKLIYQTAKSDLLDNYQIDIIDDVLLGRKDRIILYGNIEENRKIILFPISGDLSIIGLSEQKSFTLSDFVNHLDLNNKYAQVAGKKEYLNYVTHELSHFEREIDVTFPVKLNENRQWLRFVIYPVEKNPKICIFTITNVTDLLNSEELIYEKTHKDSLTGLFNKYTFDYHYGLRYRWKNLHALYLDIDDFKLINDIEGHKAGDEFLVKFANNLKIYESEYNHFYRIGGDEFVGLFFEDEQTVKQIAQGIIENTKKIKTSIVSRLVSVSIGIVRATKADDLMRKADEVLYKVKNAGKNHYLYEVEL